MDGIAAVVGRLPGNLVRTFGEGAGHRVIRGLNVQDVVVVQVNFIGIIDNRAATGSGCFFNQIYLPRGTTVLIEAKAFVRTCRGPEQLLAREPKCEEEREQW